jgi:hypothetical protein
MIKRSRNDFLKALQQQIHFLQNSCKQFDYGDEGESLRIATTLRVLLQDTQYSQSLLKQIGVKDKLLFVDSASPIEPVKSGRMHNGHETFVISAMPGLFAITPTVKGMKLVAPLDESEYARGLVSFDEWWTNGCIPGHNNVRHSRSWLLKEMANKEGGVHIDPEITRGYSELRSTSMGMVVTANGVDGFINSPADVSMRQIAWEVLETLKSPHMTEDMNLENLNWAL